MNAGCGECWSIDGNWKLCFTHCIYPVEVNIPGIAVNFPDICSKEPINSKSAFCKEHVIDWYFNDNLIKILFPDNVICGFLNIMFSC